MNLTKGQIMMIQNMVNTELSNKNTVYNPTELVNLKEQLLLYDVVKSLPTKDEISASVFNKVYNGKLSLRNVFRDEINDAYYSGALDMHEQLTK